MSSKISGFTTYFRLLSYLKRYWWQFLLGVLFTALASGIAASFTWFLKPLLNKGFIHPDMVFIGWLPFIVVGAYLVLSIAAFGGDFFITWTARHVIMHLQRTLFQKYLKLPTAYFDANTSGQLVAKLVYNAEQVAEATTTVVLTVVKDLFYAASLILVMFSNSVLLALIFLCVVPLIACIVVVAGKIMKRLSLEVQDAVGDVAHIAKEAIAGGHVVSGFNAQNYEKGKFALATWRECRKQIAVVVVNSVGSGFSRVVAAIAVAVSVYLATSPAHALSAGAFMSTIAAMLASQKPLRNLTNINNQLQKGIAGAESVFEILDEQDEQDSGVQELQSVKGEVKYSTVGFHYPGNRKQVLKEIDFTIAAGETVAVIGRSGSGKSSLVKLLPRFYDCQTGVITIDGANIKSVTLSSLRSQFSIVPQQVMLFNDTIAKNIAYGATAEVIPATIERAAKQAHALEFINELPEGFATVVGENGVLLSAGQRQRIALARAFLKNAPILILDEATSGLDAESEHYIQEALQELFRGRTTIAIAHRLSTIENSDKILLLDGGKIVAAGTHNELLANNDLYAKLRRVKI